MEQDKDDEQAGQHSLQRLLLQGEDEASQWQLKNKVREVNFLTFLQVSLRGYP